jgi:hypothetical protein
VTISAPATVQANFFRTNINHSPVTTDGASANVTMSEDGAPTAFALTWHATDADGDTLTWSVATPAAHGTATASGTGASQAIAYTPTANYNGADSFAIQVSDGVGGAATTTVSVTIQPVNDAPVAVAQSVSTSMNTAKAITLSGSDPEGSNLTYAVATQPAYGTLSGTGATRTYTPNTGYLGADSFTFRVNDGALDSAPATVSILVGGISATGGTVTNYTLNGTNWTAHIFTTVGSTSITFTAGGTVEYLVIGGGGGGGRSRAGGGGAGGYRCSVQGELSGSNSVAEEVYSVSAGVYPIQVGAGGAGATLDTGYQGGNSIFTNIVAIGGGGGKERANTARGSGGSGGGAGYLSGGAVAGASGTSGQGFSGGAVGSGSPDGFRYSNGGGGSGAGSPGTQGKDGLGGVANADPWGAGGTGLVSSITGTAVQRAGGGGGGQVMWGVATNYGGGVDVTGRRNGATSTGGGGAARWDNAAAAGEGGSGIVVVRYVANGGGGAVAPAAPTNFTATAAGTNQINLAWADQATDETGYVVDRSTDSNTWVLVVVTSVNVTNASSIGLTTNTLYYYRVAATNAGGRSAYCFASARTWSVYEAWRQTQFDSTSLTNSAISGATADPDYDGLNNEQEFWAGTIPTNASSCLMLYSLTNNPAVPGEFVLRWQSVAGKTYSVLAATNLMTGFTALTNGLPATPTVNVYTDKVNGAGQKFYRVGVE